jgi:hypothetical protein
VENGRKEGKTEEGLTTKLVGVPARPEKLPSGGSTAVEAVGVSVRGVRREKGGTYGRVGGLRSKRGDAPEAEWASACGPWAPGRGTESSGPSQALLEEGEGASGRVPPVGGRERKEEMGWSWAEWRKKGEEGRESGPS